MRVVMVALVAFWAFEVLAFGLLYLTDLWEHRP